MASNIAIAIYGGSGSGKSTLSSELRNLLGVENTTLLDSDSYYKNLSHLPAEERENINFDHPDSIDHELLVRHIRELKAGSAIEKPAYDFKTHSRSGRGTEIKPQKYVIVEGLLFLLNRHLREEFDLMIYIDADEDTRLIRRLQRDTKERGRSLDSVISQYITSVKPMHQKFIQPSKRYADLIVDFNQFNKDAIRNAAKEIRLLSTSVRAKRHGAIGTGYSALILRPMIGIRRIYQHTVGNMIARYAILLAIIAHCSLVAVREGTAIYIFGTSWPLFIRDYLESIYFPLVYMALFFISIYFIKNALFNVKQVNPQIRRYVYFELGLYILTLVSVYCFWTFYYGYY